MLAFIIVLIVWTQAAAFLVFTLAQTIIPSTPAFLALLIAVNSAIPVGAAALLYAFFRSRNRRLDRQLGHAVEPPEVLPANLIEASLAELDSTDGALTSVHKRIWWIVFLACFLSLVVGEFAGSVAFQAVVALHPSRIYPTLDGFLFTYGLGLLIAGILIAWNAIYWRRVERRLGQLRNDTNARRAAIAAFEQVVWQRV